MKTEEGDASNNANENLFTKKFSKCEKCRRSRTKVLVPNSLLGITHGKNDGVTCDFCGDVMDEAQPVTLPDVFEGRRGSKGGEKPSNSPESKSSNSQNKNKRKNYVYCGECGKVVLKESLTKHMRDVHELSNKRKCQICGKMLSGPFSLKEHVSAVHNKQTKHKVSSQRDIDNDDDLDLCFPFSAQSVTKCLPISQT